MSRILDLALTLLSIFLEIFMSSLLLVEAGSGRFFVCLTSLFPSKDEFSQTVQFNRSTQLEPVKSL